ncbi:hypothetical protein A3Q56_00037 [Intoshia linei]|uniref:FERM domain-containing protein n=1 Tax=Intoshia linei TaxID=1819745 RepID=A0A177BCY0_9BILA|nr:hypothetical protein A3Q56_00037 [Intoshia linei]
MKSTNLICNVKFIDDTCQKFTVPRKAYGSLLMNLIKTHLSLRECIYFGLYHIGQYLFSQKNSFLPDQEIKWMNLNKPLRKQFSEKIFYLQFAVKYYIEFPYLIQDESVMYNYFLQCKKNLLTNKYSSISFNDHVYLTSLAIHSDYGDFGFNSVNMEEVKSTFFLSSFQDFDAVRRQSEHLTGTPPHISEQQFLKIISDFDDYAFWKFPIRNSADNIGHIYVNFAGIIVYSFQFKPIPLKWLFANLTRMRSTNRGILEFGKFFF